MDLATSIFVLLIVIFSTVIHELMHGVAADRLGDRTARYAGRLTLNPLPHIDPMGSVLVPMLLLLSPSPILFGWAKPVPYNPYNLRPGRFSEAIVAFAGPFSNLVLALFFGLILRLGIAPSDISEFFSLIVAVNVSLCVFNLIPVPPLDGSKVLEALLPDSLRYKYANWRRRLDHNPILGMGLLLIIIVLLGGAYGAFLSMIIKFIAGV